MRIAADYPTLHRLCTILRTLGAHRKAAASSPESLVRITGTPSAVADHAEAVITNRYTLIAAHIAPVDGSVGSSNRRGATMTLPASAILSAMTAVNKAKLSRRAGVEVAALTDDGVLVEGILHGDTTPPRDSIARGVERILDTARRCWQDDADESLLRHPENFTELSKIAASGWTMHDARGSLYAIAKHEDIRVEAVMLKARGEA